MDRLHRCRALSLLFRTRRRRDRARHTRPRDRTGSIPCLCGSQDSEHRTTDDDGDESFRRRTRVSGVSCIHHGPPSLTELLALSLICKGTQAQRRVSTLCSGRASARCTLHFSSGGASDVLSLAKHPSICMDVIAHFAIPSRTSGGKKATVALEASPRACFEVRTQVQRERHAGAHAPE